MGEDEDKDEDEDKALAVSTGMKEKVGVVLDRNKQCDYLVFQEADYYHYVDH